MSVFLAQSFGIDIAIFVFYNDFVFNIGCGIIFHFYGYDIDLDMETELLVPAPYDEMYLRWLEAMIDYHNGEDERYNNAITLFNNAFDGYKKYYTRNHMPLEKGKRFIF